MTETEKKLLALVCINAYEVYLSTLHSCQALCTRALGNFCKDPVPGDLVIEISTIWHRDRDEHRFGRLLRKEHRPRYTQEKWAECGGEPDEPIPTELYWVIEPIGGGEYAWENADFIRVVETMTVVGGWKHSRSARPMAMLDGLIPIRSQVQGKP